MSPFADNLHRRLGFAAVVLAIACHWVQVAHVLAVPHEGGRCVPDGRGGAGICCTHDQEPTGDIPDNPSDSVDPGDPADPSGPAVPDDAPDGGHCPYLPPGLDACDSHGVPPSVTVPWTGTNAPVLVGFMPSRTRYAMAPKQSPPVGGHA